VTLKQQLDADLRNAMRSRDETRKSTLRLLLTAIHNAEIPAEPPPDRRLAAMSDIEREEALMRAETNFVPTGPLRQSLDDEAVLNIIRREVKQRRDSIAAYTKAGRNDLAAKEDAEAGILTAYLPPQMSRDEITAAARAVIQRVGAKGPADKGKVMGALMGELRGKAEGGDINSVVTELLAQAGT